ncbi:MAG: DUF2470 domain-containing protein [Acidimicrobiales bacterium]|nr:DUF2470 domain-containing protein [Acidimicrobiales bacterium]MCB1259328.1 DUF2470 domain-containing protein [Acidimicrobiales bacterium]
MSAPLPFGDEVVDAIRRHMNADHAGDSLAICRGPGGRPDAVTARFDGFDADGADFSVEVGGMWEPLRIPWARAVRERADVRAELVRLTEMAAETADPHR